MADSNRDVDEVRQAAGRAVLALMDASGFDAYAAGWLYDRGSQTWRYLLVTPMLQSKGPKWVYERLLRLFRKYPLPAGVSPLDVYVLDPEMEIAAFGEPWLAIDERDNPDGLTVMLTHDTTIGDLPISDGFVAFHRRLPQHLRSDRRDPSRRFDTRVRALEAA